MFDAKCSNVSNCHQTCCSQVAWRWLYHAGKSFYHLHPTLSYSIKFDRYVQTHWPLPIIILHHPLSLIVVFKRFNHYSLSSNMFYHYVQTQNQLPSKTFARKLDSNFFSTKDYMQCNSSHCRPQDKASFAQKIKCFKLTSEICLSLKLSKLPNS